MTDYSEFNRRNASHHGFSHYDTGGGCTALRREFAGIEFLITDSSGGHYSADALMPEFGVGVYQLDALGNCIDTLAEFWNRDLAACVDIVNRAVIAIAAAHLATLSKAETR